MEAPWPTLETGWAFQVRGSNSWAQKGRDADMKKRLILTLGYGQKILLADGASAAAAMEVMDGAQVGSWKGYGKDRTWEPAEDTTVEMELVDAGSFAFAENRVDWRDKAIEGHQKREEELTTEKYRILGEKGKAEKALAELQKTFDRYKEDHPEPVKPAPAVL